MSNRNEDTQGYHCPVDNSGAVLEQGGTCPSPPGTLTVPPSGPMTFRGVGDVPPAPEVKVGEGAAPCYLERTANLDPDFLTIPLYPPTKCKPRYIVLECNCGRRIVPSTCMSLDCESCRPHVGSRRSNSVLKRLMGHTLYQRRQYHNKTIIYTIFTVPKAIRERYLDKNEWQNVRKKAWGILKKHFGAKYAVEASHPHGDKNPGVFHPHLNFLWVQEGGYKPFIDVDLLRKKWMDVLKVDTSDVYSQYTNKIARIIHWTSYVGRTFPGNHKWTGSMRWYGKYPRVKEPVDYLCNDCGIRFRLIGYVSAEDVDNWIEYGQLAGLDPPWMRDACIMPVKKGRKPVRPSRDSL